MSLLFEFTAFFSPFFLFLSFCFCFLSFSSSLYIYIILYVIVFGKTLLYMCIEYRVQVNMYYMGSQGVDECMINAHDYIYYYVSSVPG